MKFLVDNALSPKLVDELVALGHEAVHVRDRGLAAAEDDVIFDLAAEEDRIVVSADTDFGTILAARKSNRPSVILFRRSANRSVEAQAALLASNLNAVARALEEGSLVVIEETRLRIRRLPIAD